jgi:hypothetical protein
VIVDGHLTKVFFHITNIGREDAILGIDWLRHYNPQVNWKLDSISFLRCGACREQAAALPEIKSNSVEPGPTPVTPGDTTEAPFYQINANQRAQSAWWAEGLLTSQTDELWAATGFTYSQAIAKEASRAKGALKGSVPEEYREFSKVFSEQESKQLPEHKLYNHWIDLKPNAPETLHAKVYPMLVNEQAELDQFLAENLWKGYIVPSKSPMSSPVLFIKKKDGKLRLIQDYRKLNDITVKNHYPLLLASDIINQLRGAQYFTKFDVQWGYTNVRIKEGNKWKAAFSTNRGLFKPKVMFFGMTNSLATFQGMMNTIFANLVVEGRVAMYLNDILIFTATKEEHRRITRKVLKCLQDNDLYLHPKKCKFKKESVEYLGLIISEGQVCMDPAKVAAVKLWALPKNLRNVCAFIGFANFYRWFIKDFAKIARPLHDLTKKDVP